MDVTQRAVDFLRIAKDEKHVSREKIINRNRKYYYALNNLLYFKIKCEINNANNTQVWDALAEELSAAKENKKEYWQFRFDHTLAFYEYRKFIISKKQAKPNSAHLFAANDYIKIALKGLVIDKEDYDDLQKEISKQIGQL